MSPSHCSFPLRAPHYRGADDNVPLHCDDGSQGLFSRSMLAFNRGAADDAKTLERYDNSGENLFVKKPGGWED